MALTITGENLQTSPPQFVNAIIGYRNETPPDSVTLAH